ncbi:MAG: hypothetical protein PHD09_07970, partial [Candidatus Omnitrophica bacterium]|nr:hypothetical protein [Candidatus Omnitrophota bacterium]
RLMAALAEMFGDSVPTPSFIAQPPLKDALVAVECVIIRPKQEDKVNIEYKEAEGIRYAVVSHDGLRWVYAGGLSDDSKEDTLEASQAAFARMERILSAEKLKFSDVMRQWNYIEDIIGYTEDGKKQKYQIFNDVRSIRYQKADFSKRGYPAATGIGMDCGGVIIEFIALDVGRRRDVVIGGVVNLLQRSAHDYTKRMLEGEAVLGLKEKTTPKFERAKVVLLRRRSRDIASGESQRWIGWLFISGTASIRGEETVKIGDVEGQTRMTLENIAYLISAENLMHPLNLGKLHLDVEVGAGLSDLLRVRTYAAEPNDFTKISDVAAMMLPVIPNRTVAAAVCRPNLLVETEGDSRIRFKGVSFGRYLLNRLYRILAMIRWLFAPGNPAFLQPLSDAIAATAFPKHTSGSQEKLSACSLIAAEELRQLSQELDFLLKEYDGRLGVMFMHDPISRTPGFELC